MPLESTNCKSVFKSLIVKKEKKINPVTRSNKLPFSHNE